MNRARWDGERRRSWGALEREERELREAFQDDAYSVSSRTSEVAGDGFLYDDEPAGKAGPKSPEVRAHMQAAVARMVRAGYSTRAIKRVTGLATNTVIAYRRLVTEPTSCPCGIALVVHPAWCRVRFQASRKRQDFMREWHPNAEWPLIERDGFRAAWESPQAADAVDPHAAVSGKPTTRDKSSLSSNSGDLGADRETR